MSLKTFGKTQEEEAWATGLGKNISATQKKRDNKLNRNETPVSIPTNGKIHVNTGIGVHTMQLGYRSRRTSGRVKELVQEGFLLERPPFVCSWGFSSIT